MPKISALPVITSPDSADELPIVDTSTSSTKKMTLTKLKEWLQSLVGWVTNAMIADTSITNAKLSTTAGEVGGAPTTWSLDGAGWTLGNGTQTAYYTKIGKLIFFSIDFTLGSTSAMGNGTFPLPVTASMIGINVVKNAIGTGWTDDISTSANNSPIIVRLETSTTGRAIVQNAAGTYLTTAGLSVGTPFTWATGDNIYAQGTYWEA